MGSAHSNHGEGIRKGKSRYLSMRISVDPQKRPNGLNMKRSTAFYASVYKEMMIVAYGGKCVCCNERTPEFLTIDHIHGDGQEDRKKNGSGYQFYKYLRSIGYPKDRYRLLCMNCNFAIRFGKICPHQKESDEQIGDIPPKSEFFTEEQAVALLKIGKIYPSVGVGIHKPGASPSSRESEDMKSGKLVYN